MIATRRTWSTEHGWGVFVEQQSTWSAWLGVQRGSGLVWVVRWSRDAGSARWCGELEGGRLRRWCLHAAGGHHFHREPVRRVFYRQNKWSPPRLARKVFRTDRRPDWTELVLVARAARRTAHGVAILDWLRERGTADVPCLGVVLGLDPLGADRPAA